MTLTAQEYYLLKKILPKYTLIRLDKNYKVFFQNYDNNAILTEQVSVRKVIKDTVKKFDLTKLTDNEKITMILLLGKCIKP